jgi:hypothetical protein
MSSYDAYSNGDRVGYLGGKDFNIHTHPALKNGAGGSGEPSPKDLLLLQKNSKYPHYILSRQHGVTQYNEKGAWKRSYIK